MKRSDEMSAQKKGNGWPPPKIIYYRMGQAKKKLTKLNKEVADVKNKMKALEAQLKKAKSAERAKPKAKKRPARRKAAKRR
jgi:cell division protein FtsL